MTKTCFCERYPLRKWKSVERHSMTSGCTLLLTKPEKHIGWKVENKILVWRNSRNISLEFRNYFWFIWSQIRIEILLRWKRKYSLFHFCCTLNYCFGFYFKFVNETLGQAINFTSIIIFNNNKKGFNSCLPSLFCPLYFSLLECKFIRMF